MAIEKGNGKIAIICGRFYVQMPIKELVIEKQLNTNRTGKYLPNNNKELLILPHSKWILKIFEQKVSGNN